MVRQGIRRRAWGVTVLFSLVMCLAALPLHGPEVDGMYQKNEISHLVIVDDSSFRLNYSPWESLFCGEVNRTTNITFRLMNNHGAPFYGVRVDLSVYWFDGILTGYQSGEQKVVYVESLRVMHTDSRTVDIGPGVGNRSEVIGFEWVPRFSGSYIWNLSVHVVSDLRPVSDVIYPAGIVYRTAQNSSYYNGLWVGTYYTNCSEMSGWTSESEGGVKGISWHVSSHPLAQGDPFLHSPGDAFWVGNETTRLAPTTGVYSLISPRFDLSRFDGSAFSWELKKGAPQIFLLYKYRGKISQEGGLFHYISTDDGETWEKLLDPLDRHVNITGETDSPIWDHTSHNSKNGGSTKYGLDLSRYHGKQVRIRIEYHPSGNEETGFLIDDIALEGKERVDISSFSITGWSNDHRTVDPGSQVKYWAEITPFVKDQSPVRAEPFSLPPFLAGRGVVSIDPPAFALAGDRVRVNITMDVPRGAPSGPSHLSVRFAGPSTTKDLTFIFNVKDVHSLTSSVEGGEGQPMEPDRYETVLLTIRNNGNIRENVYTAFASDGGLEWDQGKGREYGLGSGETVKASIGVRTVETDHGPRSGFIVWSTGQIAVGESTILESIRSGNAPDDWSVHRLDYFVERIVDVSLFAPQVQALISDPPSSGESQLQFKVYVMNRGNSQERIALNSSLDEPGINITLTHRANLTIGAGIIDTVVQLNATITYPINPGNYQIHFKASAEGDFQTADNALDFSIRIGSGADIKGIFIDEGSVSIAPAEPVMGSESVVSFKAYTFALPDNAPFDAVIRINGEVASKQEFLTSGIGYSLCQMKWVPEVSGDVFPILSIEYPILSGDPPEGLVVRTNFTVRVRYVDIALSWTSEPKNATVPGTYYYTVKVLNRGDVRADLVNVTMNVTTGNETRSISRNADLDPNSETILTFGPFLLRPRSMCSVTVENPESLRWKDNDTSDNRLFSQQIRVGNEPPEDPLWRDGLFLGIAAFAIGFIAVALFVALYRRR